MLSPEVIALGRDRATIAMGDRRREFAREIAQIQACEVDRGMYQSGVAQGKLCDAIREEFQARATAIWKALGDVVDSRALGQDSALASHLMELATDLLDSNSDDLRRWHQTAVQIMASPPSMFPLSEYRAAALARVQSDIDVAVLESRRQADGARESGADVFQFKPSLYGVGIDLKALWRRIRRKRA